jgi:hypothetical protein
LTEKLVGQKKSPGIKKVKLKESDIIVVIKEAKEVIKKEPIV